jgi:hypothetical protein
MRSAGWFAQLDCDAPFGHLRHSGTATHRAICRALGYTYQLSSSFIQNRSPRPVEKQPEFTCATRAVPIGRQLNPITQSEHASAVSSNRPSAWRYVDGCLYAHRTMIHSTMHPSINRHLRRAVHRQLDALRCTRCIAAVHRCDHFGDRSGTYSAAAHAPVRTRPPPRCWQPSLALNTSSLRRGPGRHM